MNAQTFPHEVTSRNGRVRIYRTLNRGYTQFRLAHYVDGRRKLETFSKFPHALKRARAILKSINRPPRRRT